MSLHNMSSAAKGLTNLRNDLCRSCGREVKDDEAKNDQYCDNCSA